MVKLNIQRFADADIIIGTSVDTKGLEDGLKDIIDDINDADVEVEPDIDMDDVDKKVKLLGTGIATVMGKAFGKVGKILGTVVKELDKNMLLTIGGVLGTVLLIAMAFKKLLNDNEDLSKQWEQIKTTFGNLFTLIGSAIASVANVLLPVLKAVLNFLQRMLQYVGYILQAWFGINIFATKTDKSLAKGTKQAKEMNKQLAGFDEMNVLSDNSQGGGKEDTNVGMIKPLQEGEAPAWLKWIADNGETIRNIILGIGTAISIVMLIMNATNPVAWIMLIIGALALLITNWDKIKNFFIGIGKWVYDNVLKPVIDFISNFISTIINNIVTMISNIFTLLSPIYKKVYDIIIKPIINAFKSMLATIKNIFSGVVTFFSSIWNKVKSIVKSFAVKVGDTITNVIKGVINGILTKAENVLNTPIKAINKLLDTINALPGVNMKPLQTFKLPRLAKGGIINMPGRGVAIGGEKAPEGVIPLTDSQQMALLGEAIGKYITINANITNTMNGRVISRELQKINGESDFAFNR